MTHKPPFSAAVRLSREEMQRYRGHISLCEIDFTGQQALLHARVLIVGAGGLGSPVALYLAGAGVGTIGIVDADTVSLSNLQRQIMHGTPDLGRLKVESARESMLHINPDVTVETHHCFLTPENAADIIGAYDIVADCTDNFTVRLLISDTCERLGKPYAYAAVSRFSGQLFTHLPGTATYRTIFNDADSAPEETSCAINGILNTVVGVVGSLQATEIVKYLTHTGDLLTNRLLLFDAITMEFHTLAVAH